MSLLRIFSKPHWQSKDPSVRRDAVGRDDDPALLSCLPSLAREDEDGGVRLAALKRLADPGLCQTAAHDDADPAVRKSAALLLLELLSGTHAKAPSLSDRMRLLRAQDEQKLLEHVALNAPEAELAPGCLAAGRTHAIRS
jgi:exonuclease SbcC